MLFLQYIIPMYIFKSRIFQKSQFKSKKIQRGILNTKKTFAVYSKTGKWMPVRLVFWPQAKTVIKLCAEILKCTQN